MRPEGPTHWLLDGPTGWRGALLNAVVESRSGLRLAARETGPKLYRERGRWISAALDSRIYDCDWDRIEIILAALPGGASVRVLTYTDNAERTPEDIANLPEHLWRGGGLDVGVAPALQETDTEAAKARVFNHPVLSDPGQYLWLQIRFAGDGYDTPIVGAASVHYPRDSYLQYLPAVFSADEQARRFLQRFLALFQMEWDGVEHQIETFPRHLDPASVPDDAWARWLADWLALPLEGDWDLPRQRRLLAAAPAIYEKRGTPEALRRYVQVYLANLSETGVASPAAAYPAFPLIIEGFRKRNYLMLGDESSSTTLSTARPGLWSPAVSGRLQLDVYSRADHGRLVSTGDPDLDLFRENAHRFEVFLPSAWIETQQDERRLRRAIDTEKPAHTQYRLCLVEARLRVGVQSCVGVDTIIGAIPETRLGGAGDADTPASRPPRQRLGYDTVLGGEGGGMALTPGIRIHSDTILS